MHIQIFTLKKGLIIFWAFFYSWICLTNIFDGLKELHLLPNTWFYTSGNFAFILSVVKLQNFSKILAAILFSGDILWQAITAVFFWSAVFQFEIKEETKGLSAVTTAFALGIALWATFIMAVEIFIAYEKISEGTFFQLLIANLISLLFIGWFTSKNKEQISLAD